MPRVSFFYGIAITMYWNEGKHAVPHFHARYSGAVAAIDFDGRVIAGDLPVRALKLVEEWAGLHRDELTENWERARRDQTINAIDPLP